MATRPVDNDWETIKGGDEWEDVTGVEDARQQLLNSPTSRAAMAAHLAHRRESEGPPDVPTALGESLQSLGEGAVNAAKGLWHLGTTRPEQLGPELLQAEKNRQADITKRASESTPLGSAALQTERTPILGPIAAGAVDLAGKGFFGTHKEFAKTLGEQATPLAIGGIAGKALKGTARVAARPDLQGAVGDFAQMLRKTGAASNEQIGELAPRLQEAIPEIHHQAIRDNVLFDNIDTAKAVDLVNKAKNNLWKENVTRHMNTLGGVRSDMSSIPQAMKKGLDPQIAEHAAIIDEIDKLGATDFAKPWSMQRIENRIQSLNAETKSTDFALKVGQAKAGAKLRMLDALRDLEADRIGAITGEDISAFKHRYGSLAETEKYLEKAHNINEGTKLSTPKQGKLATSYNKLKEVDISHPFAVPEKVAKSIVNVDLSPDQLIGRSLKKMGGRSQRVAPGAYKGKTPLALPPAPAGNYPEQGTPVEPNMNMEQYLNLNNVSPEAQQFLGVRETPLKRTKSLSPPPERP